MTNWLKIKEEEIEKTNGSPAGHSSSALSPGFPMAVCYVTRISTSSASMTDGNNNEEGNRWATGSGTIILSIASDKRRWVTHKT